MRYQLRSAEFWAAVRSTAGMLRIFAISSTRVWAASVPFKLASGAVLIANTAGLTVVERRREIGVLKAVGYTSGQVLRVLLSEYGFLGTLAGLGGIIGAAVAIVAIAFMSGAPLSLEPMILGGMLLFSIAIALLSAAAVTWHPTRVRPLDVLRYE